MKLNKVCSLLTVLVLLNFGAPCAIAGDFFPGLESLCITFEVAGLCLSPTPPYVGVRIRYWEPALLVETVKRPGDTVVPGMGEILAQMTAETSKSLMASVTGLPLAVTSGSQSSAVSGANLKFNDVHVYAFPFPDIVAGQTGLSCGISVPPAPFVKYLSELDAVEWRMGIMETLSPKSLASAALGSFCFAVGKFSAGLCMGAWGPVYPRRGFFVHQSEVVGSAATAYRAVSIASLDGFTPHVVLAPLGFIPAPEKDRMQLIYPMVSPCINIGALPAFWENYKLSWNGKYVWIYWRHRECCVF